MNSSDRLDWTQYNILENLFLNCCCKCRSVPKESGAHFRVSNVHGDAAICMIYKIDRAKDPLIRAPIKRPDYLVLYASNNLCILTIIELESHEEKKLKDGIEQIMSFREVLNKCIKEHLPNKYKYKMQGILLTSVNADFPRKKIYEIVKKHQFTILPISCNIKAELYDCISKVNKIDDKQDVTNRYRMNGNEFNYLEDILVNKQCKTRLYEKFNNKKIEKVKNRLGLFVNYKIPPDGHMILYVNKIETVIATNKMSTVMEELKKCKMDSHFKIEPIK